MSHTINRQQVTIFAAVVVIVAVCFILTARIAYGAGFDSGRTNGYVEKCSETLHERAAEIYRLGANPFCAPPRS